MFELYNKFIALVKGDLNTPQAKLVLATLQNPIDSPAVLTELKGVLTAMSTHPECGPVFQLSIDAIDHVLTTPSGV